MSYPWCMMLVPQLAGTEKAAMFSGALWPKGSIIRIAFLDGDASLQGRVKEAAQEWLTRTEANLTFSWLDNPVNAQIRISFLWKGSWSLLGRYAEQRTDPRLPTMNYGWLEPSSTDAEVREVVLHEFGHALGFIHEHQNPEGGILWNDQKVIQELSGPPNNWTEEQIIHNVLFHYDKKDITGTPFDPDSIMLYPFPAEWTRNGVGTKSNPDLSPLDIQMARDTYR